MQLTMLIGEPHGLPLCLVCSGEENVKSLSLWQEADVDLSTGLWNGLVGTVDGTLGFAQAEPPTLKLNVGIFVTGNVKPVGKSGISTWNSGMFDEV